MLYDAVLIDADDTLFDFHAAEKNAIAAVMHDLDIRDPEAPLVYRRLNKACWEEFEQGRITQERLRVKRFEDFLRRYERGDDPETVGRRYTEALARQSALLPGALETVRAIARRLPVAIVTNGISSVQRGRMAASPLREYISAFIISGEQGFQKPDPRMVFAALEALGGVDARRALMVGDSLTSDIRAANRAGVDACWYNPEGKPAPVDYDIRYEISDIRALPEIAIA